MTRALPSTTSLRRSAAAIAAAGALCVLAAGPAVAAPPATPPMLLPGDASAAAVRADGATWIVAARPGAAGRRLARAHGGRPAGRHGAYVVPRSRARALAAALDARGLLAWAEPNRIARRAATAASSEPLSPLVWWRDAIVGPDLDHPAVTPQSPRLGLIDTPVDFGHSEMTGGNIASSAAAPPAPYDEHGTGTAGVASAPVNGVGIAGVWPGMRVLSLPLPREITCDASAKRIDQAVAARVATINMSYGSDQPCFTEYVSLQYATAAGVVLVAAAGNELADGNPLEYPASLPHVISVAAVDRDLRSTYFSNANAGVDLSAPGQGVLTTVPVAFDSDGTPDGFMAMDGTSFSAPMVAAAATWVRAARPKLDGGQIGDVLRLSAKRLGDRTWSASTGYGLLDVAAALREPSPPRDPLEPNDEIVWVNGDAFGRPDPPLYQGGSRPATLRASLDALKDPLDVYRVVIPPRGRLSIELSPYFGETYLDVFDRGARSTDSRSQRLAYSHRAGGRTNRVVVRNRTREKRSAYVAVSIRPGGQSLNAYYRLTVKRTG